MTFLTAAIILNAFASGFGLAYAFVGGFKDLKVGALGALTLAVSSVALAILATHS